MKANTKQKNKVEKNNGLKKIGILILLLALVSLYVILPIMSTLQS